MPRKNAHAPASSAETAPLSPAERRQRHRQEMVESILAASRAVMQENGVAALNLNEVARRVRIRPQSLAGYFPTKAALYDALVCQAYTAFREGDEAAYRDHPPGWDQIEAWFANRIAIALADPERYQLAFDAPVPDYAPADRAVELSQEILVGARRMVADAIQADILQPGIPVEQATDVLLALRRGLVAERIGKQPFVPAISARFDALLPIVMHMIRTAWAPAAETAAARCAQPTREGDADG